MPSPELNVKIGAVITDLERELAKAKKGIKKLADTTEQQSKKIKKSSTGISKSVKTLIGVIGAVEVLRFGVNLVKDLGKLAVQMEGESRRAAIVFGQSLAFVTKEAEKNAIALGLTRHEYIAAAAATQDLLIPLGFQRKEASRLSTELTNLSGVLSNWVGGQKTAKEVSEILTKAILGETEQIKTLGIKIDQTSKAFNQRIKQLQITKGLTLEQAKALEILTQITEKSTDAQIEFTNETKSLAQQEAIANAMFREQAEILAQDLTPAYIAWINTKTKLATVTGDLAFLLSQEIGLFKKLEAIVNLTRIGGLATNAINAEGLRQELKRLSVAEEAFDLLVKTTDEEAARTLVNNLTLKQLEALIESQKKLNAVNEEASKIVSKVIEPRKQRASNIDTSTGAGISPIDTSKRVEDTLAPITTFVDKQLLELLVLLQEFNAEAGVIINEGIADTFSGIAEAIGNALASGGNVLKAGGAALLGGVGDILVNLGKMAIKIGVGIKAIKTALKSLNPVIAIAAGVALVALGSAFKAGASKLAESGGSSSGARDFSGSTSGVGSRISTQGSINNVSPSDTRGRVLFEIEGTKLVGVLSNVTKRNKALGGSNLITG